MSGTSKSSREHSNAFKKLIPDYKDDPKVPMQQIIAYFIYKKRKVWYLEKYTQSHGEISDEAFNQYQKNNQLTDSEIEKIKLEASEFMDEFIHSVRIEGIKEAVKKPFWKEVLLQTVTTVVSAIGLFVLYIALTALFSGNDKAKQVLDKFFSIEQPPPNATP